METPVVFQLSIARYDWHDFAIFTSVEKAKIAGSAAMVRYRSIDPVDSGLFIPDWTWNEDLAAWLLEYGDAELAIVMVSLDEDPDWFTDLD